MTKRFPIQFEKLGCSKYEGEGRSFLFDEVGTAKGLFKSSLKMYENDAMVKMENFQTFFAGTLIIFTFMHTTLNRKVLGLYKVIYFNHSNHGVKEAGGHSANDFRARRE